MAKEKAGDGSALAPMRWWQPLYRSVMGIEHSGVRWDIEIDFFDWDEPVHLYRDRRQDRSQRSKARFELADGSRIEVATSTFGLRRAHLVTPAGSEHQLTPAPGTAERWRAELGRRRPTLSRWLGRASWTILAIALILQIPQLIALGAQMTDWYTFTSPVTLPASINTPLTVAGVLAGIERALRLRYHWLLD